MSGKRQKGGAHQRAREMPHRRASARRKPTRLGLFVTVGVLLVTGTIAWLWLSRWAGNPVMPVPEVPIADLEPTAAELIRRHLDMVRAAPRSGDAWGKLGALLKSFGYRDQALACLKEAERLDPREPRWPYLQVSLSTGGPTAVTIERLRRAVARCDNDPEMPRLRLVQLLAQAGEERQAREELEQLLRAKPSCGPARMLMAHLSHARDEWDQSFAMANECTTNAYTARSAWTLLAALHRRQGDTNRAEFATGRAAAVSADAAWPDPYEEEVLALRNDARSLSDRAQTYLLAGRPADALPLVTKLAREHPGFAETWLLLGRTQYLQNQPTAAEQSLRRFLQLDPGSINGHFQLGMSLMAQKRYAEAAGTFQHVTSLRNNFGPALFNLGFALAKSGKPREAINPFREAIRHNPEMIDAYILLADLHLQLGEKAGAVALADRAERLNPADPRLPALRQKIAQD
jgi:tetratricopeptide (TPR) repeat protein